MQQIREWLRQATSVAALTGAGVSAESGIPTFRGAGGLWRNNRPEDLATPAAFARDPRLVWEWYDWRRSRIAEAGPNPGHIALVELEKRVERFTLITQNVDGLHERAGSRNVLKLHGDIWRLRCVGCGKELEDRRPKIEHLPPRCECGGLLRPGVVWFGESLPQDVWHAAAQASQQADVFLVIGTSAVVYPAAGLVPAAKAAGAKVIEINIEETPFSGALDGCLRGPSGELLPQLIA